MKTLFLSRSFVMQPAPSYIAGYRWNGPRRGEKPRPVPMRPSAQPSEDHATTVTDSLLTELEPTDAQQLGAAKRSNSEVDLGEPSTFDLGDSLEAQKYQGKAQATVASAVQALAQRIRGPNTRIESADTESIVAHLALDGTWQQALQEVAMILGIGKKLPQVDTTVAGFDGISFVWRSGALTYSVRIQEQGAEYEDGYTLIFSDFEVGASAMPEIPDTSVEATETKKPPVVKQEADGPSDPGDPDEGETEDGDEDDGTVDDDPESELDDELEDDEELDDEEGDGSDEGDEVEEPGDGEEEDQGDAGEDVEQGDLADDSSYLD